MEGKEFHNIIEFLRNSEQLKTTYRSGNTSDGRKESVAAHTWRLCLMALILEDYFPEVNISHVIKICIVHDLGEALSGDIPAPSQNDSTNKAEIERNDLLQLTSSLPRGIKEKLVNLWEEYEEASTAEAKTAKALDKLETIIQHNQGINSPDFDYAFNLTYGQEYTSIHPILSTLRNLLDQETRKQSSESKENN